MSYDIAIWRPDDRFIGLPCQAEYEIRAKESEQRSRSGSNIPSCPEFYSFCWKLGQLAISRDTPLWEGPLSGDIGPMVVHDFLYLNLTCCPDDDDLGAILAAAESAYLVVYDPQWEEILTSPQMEAS
ncbi:MAG: hypothetical protein ACT4QF_18535 [Sporichthyaceae bacterium]